MADQRTRQVERAVQNHAPDQLPIRIGRFSERLVRPDRSIVDQDVDPAKLGQRSGGQRLDLGLFADVGENRDRLDPQIPGLTRDGLRRYRRLCSRTRWGRVQHAAAQGACKKQNAAICRAL